MNHFANYFLLPALTNFVNVLPSANVVVMVNHVPAGMAVGSCTSISYLVLSAKCATCSHRGEQDNPPTIDHPKEQHARHLDMLRERDDQDVCSR